MTTFYLSPINTLINVNQMPKQCQDLDFVITVIKLQKKMTDIVYLPFLPLYALIHFPYGTVLGVVDSHYLQQR